MTATVGQVAYGYEEGHEEDTEVAMERATEAANLYSKITGRKVKLVSVEFYE